MYLFRQILGRYRNFFVLLLIGCLIYFVFQAHYSNSQTVLRTIVQPKINTDLFNESSVWKQEENERNVVQSMTKCLDVVKEAPYLLFGTLNQDLIKFNDSTVAEVLHNLYLLYNVTQKTGGAWRPNWCQSRYKVAVIIPYRDRKSHLDRLIIYLSPLLRRQWLDYRVIVAEQTGNDSFNKGRVMNAAFTFAYTLRVDCVIFHDVDIFPQDDRIPYGCPEQPFHMGGRVNTLNYVIWYHNLVGGALAFRMKHFIMVNGYSNQYWGWGGEDDDMGKRILANKLKITRPDEKIGRYTMVKHKQRHRHPSGIVHKVLADALNRYKIDGLNTKKAWNITKISKEHLYYHVFVDVGKVPDEWKLPETKNSKSSTLTS